eukprot:CAMPEP_0198684758 /NCGR_PEP_ID=MMETSP1468-20131203/12659_1 /TAXON_ID=1461545 /ORGANISM="Mantoniella sp, Strain CCMP1436" /LENGTH=48 /DNA_ID= /DNA_START= /DNA_END= /DNA_ORIENTATION=
MLRQVRVGWYGAGVEGVENAAWCGVPFHMPIKVRTEKSKAKGRGVGED